MSLLSYTYSDLKTKAVEHALGRSPDSRIDSGLIVNRALDFLVKFKAWSWRRRLTVLNIAGAAITSLVRSSNVVTGTKTAHGLAVGDYIRVTGAVPAGFNRCFTVASTPTADTWTHSDTGDDESATTAGTLYTGYLALPSDLFAIDHLTVFESTNWSIWKANPEEIMRIRVDGKNDQMVFFWCTSTVPQTTATNTATVRLELAPLPSSDQAAALGLSYLRGIPTLTSDTARADIPYLMNETLFTLCRAWAFRTEMPESPGAAPAWAEAMDALSVAAREDDRLELGIQGVIRGPVDQYMGLPREWRPHQSITLPTG